MRARSAALVAATIPLSTLLTAVAVIALVIVWQLLVGFAIVLAIALFPVLHAAAAATHGRRPKPERDGAAVPEPELERLVAEEAAAHGLPAPALRVGAGRGVEVQHGDAIVIGIAALAERSPALLRIAIGEALLLDADRTARRLVRLREGVVTRALSVAEEHPIASRLWVAHPRLADRLIASALRERAAATEAVLAARHGTVATKGHVAAREHDEAFDWYWSAWVVPCLRAGFHPPVADGWRRWLDAPGRRDLDALESAVLAARDPSARLVAIDWERVAEAVVLPDLRDVAPDLGDATVADAADLARDGDEHEVAAALTVALADAGWRIELRFAEGVCACWEDSDLWTFDFTAAAAEGEVTPEQWRAFAEEMGIASLRLTPRTLTFPDDLAAIPVGGSAVVRLRSSRGRRLRTLALVAAGLAFALPLAGITLVAALGPGWSPGTQAFLYGLAASVGGGSGLWAWLRMRLVWSAGTLSIGPDAVRIEHPGHLKAPFEVPRARLRTAVAETEPGRDEQGRTVRFPVGSAWEGVGGWLWVGGAGFVPMLGAPGDRPTVALVFTEPVAAPHVRHSHTHGPQRGEGIAGLLLCADDPAEAKRALAALGFTPELRFEDAQLLVEAYGLPQEPVSAAASA